MMDTDTAEAPFPFLGPLDKQERRVLGVLIEKGLTTPEYYPLTIKALTTGCNQKNNRSPLTSYDEYDVEEVLDKLRKRGLVAAVQTAGGRTERFRHLLRDAAGWPNKQLAIMGELLLRGRQQTGELRTRASRMFAIDSLEELREELERLMAAGYVQSTGDLQRRGVEIDHTLYFDQENRALVREADPPEEHRSSARPAATATETPAFTRPAAPDRGQSPETASATSAASVPAAVDQTSRQQIAALESEVAALTDRIAELTDRLTEIERQLGI